MKVYPGIIETKLDINANLNLNEFVKDFHNIIEITNCYIKGSFEYINEELQLNLDVKTDLILADNNTLEPVNYSLDFKLDLIFGNSDNSDYTLDNEINLSEIVYGHILVYKPQTTSVSEDLEEKIVKKVNPAFKELKDWNK